jgi:SSS family solute:Na+ symporter
MTFLAILVGYAALMVALGAFVSRRVRGSSDFFVAGRKLSAGLVFSTLLAANIGAGSTVGAAGLGYRDGFSAWWWVGSAGIGSLVLALTVGPRIWRLASKHNLYTAGDYLEFRYDRRVKGLVALLLWVGSLAILAGQLIAIAWVLNASAGVSKPLGCAIGAAVSTAYFAFGGLHSAARVNALQLVIKLVGFGLAFVYLLGPITGIFAAASTTSMTGGYFSFFGDGITPFRLLVLLAPSFIVSPGLLQKVFGARDERAVVAGVGLNALGLLAFAIVPPLLGMLAKTYFPDLTNRELALPTLLTEALPVWLGGLLLGAIFAAEVSTADAVLFMLSTSLSKDLYKTFLQPEADDRHLMRVARGSAIACGVVAAFLGMLLPNVISALTIFYTLLSAALFLPVIAGLYVRAATARAALTTIAVSVTLTLACELLTGGKGFRGIPSLVLGILAGVFAMIAVIAIERIRDRG